MKRLKIIFLVLVVVGIWSCSKDFLEEDPPHFATADGLYKTVDGFEAGINGLYSLVRQEKSGLKYTGGFGLIDLKAQIYLAGTDNIATGSTGGLTTIMADWTKNDPTDSNLNEMFLWLYKVVNASNQIITRAESADVNWDEQTKNRILAEAHTIRGWAYRHLTYLWGDVPLLTEEVSGENIQTDLTREKVSKVRRLMINDFKFGAENLDWQPYKAGRMTKGVPQTYLAETYLAMGKPDSALVWANKAIEEGPYSLVTSRYGAGSNKPGVPFMDMFNPDNTNITSGNTEALWVLQWEPNSVGGGDNLMRHETTIRYESAKYSERKGMIASTTERGGRGWSRQTLTKQALLLYYESSDSLTGKLDQRGSHFALKKFFIVSEADDIEDLINTKTGENWKVGDTVWLATPQSRKKIPDPGFRSLSGAYNFHLLPEDEDNNNDWPYSLKWAYCDQGFPRTTESHQDQIYLRLAETILLRAEARGRLGDLSGAAEDINLLRDRANAKEVTISDFGSGLQDFLDFILDERSRELLEEEQRRYTLLRMGGKHFFYRRVKEWNLIDENLSLRDTLFPIPQTVIDANLNSGMEQNPGF